MILRKLTIFYVSSKSKFNRGKLRILNSVNIDIIIVDVRCKSSKDISCFHTSGKVGPSTIVQHFFQHFWRYTDKLWQNNDWIGQKWTLRHYSRIVQKYYVVSHSILWYYVLCSRFWKSNNIKLWSFLKPTLHCTCR